MMDTRIALCPRGTSFETFRTFEALRAGCVVVAEALPRRWFYDGAPLVTIGDWRDLGGVLAELLSDREALERRHQASQAWWRDRCSEDALGAYLSDCLNTLDLASP